MPAHGRAPQEGPELCEGAPCKGTDVAEIVMSHDPGEADRRRPGAPSFRGLGPQSRGWLAGMGITTPEQLAAHDPFEVYARIKAAQPRASLNLLHALIGAVEDRDWREVARMERTPILLRLEEMGLL